MSTRKNIISKDVTIRDVAAEAGVSISLVSYVLNAPRGPKGEYLCSASHATALRIVEAAERLGYHKNTAASSLRSGHSNTIGVIVTDITNTCFSDICRKIENLSAEAGYLTIIGSSDDQPRKLSLLIDKFLNSGVDGIIVSPCPGSEEAINKAAVRNVPVVLIDRDMPSLDKVGRVLLDNVMSGNMAVSHLIKRGYKKIEFIKYETTISTLMEREAGYLDQMRKSGLDEYIKVRVVSRETMMRDMTSVVRMSYESGADAVIFPSNTITVSGISAINALGYRIPDDLAVVGFDQNDRAGIFHPEIAFVEQPTKLVAECSFKMLVEAIRDDQEMSSLILDPMLYSRI